MAELRELHTSELRLDPSNANLGTSRGDAALGTSLREYGAGRSILIDRNGTVIAGNKTLLKARQLGINDVVVVQTDGTKIVAVQRMDLDVAQDSKARALAYADNRVGELDLDWDVERLARDIDNGLQLPDELWSESEMARLMRGLEDPLTQELDDDTSVEVPEESRCQAGQIWKLGSHRLAIGDSTDRALIARLFDGQRARLMWTDPPYGVDYEGKTAEGLTIQNDNAAGLAQLLARAFEAANSMLENGSAFYICHPAGPNAPMFASAVALTHGWAIHQNLVWLKNAAVLGHSDYHYQHEPIVYGWKGQRHSWFGGRAQSSVMAYDRPARNDLHPTMKPAALVATCIRNSTKRGDIVFDPFGGSGTTLIASHRIDRICYTVELDPKYAEVIIRRWEEATCQKAELEVGKVELV